MHCHGTGPAASTLSRDPKRYGDFINQKTYDPTRGGDPVTVDVSCPGPSPHSTRSGTS